jgi:hypothetical protein
MTRAGPGFVLVTDRPISACPIGPIYPDGAGPDRGSFAAIRQSLDRGELPAAEQVRTEELINAVAGPWEPPNASDALSVNVEVATCPWAADHRLVRVTVRAAGEPNFQQQPAPATAPASVGLPERDLSLRIKFSPTTAAAYRLIGYDAPPAGAPAADPGTQAAAPPTSIPPGRSLTVLYEVIPAGRPIPGAVPAGRSTRAPVTTTPSARSELLSALVGYRDARTGSPRTAEASTRDDVRPFDAVSPAFRDAAAAAALGLAFRDDRFRGSADYDLVLRLLEHGPPEDPSGPRAALLQVTRQAKALSRSAAPSRPPVGGS